MSLFPSPVLVRLQELKLWQGNYDSLLQNKSKEGTRSSDFDTIEGVSALDSSRSSPFPSPERDRSTDWDKKAISPTKPFEELLEEKLALDKPLHVQAKPKRPFLKKGSGLLRYKLSEQALSQKREFENIAAVDRSGKNQQSFRNKRLDKKGSTVSAPAKICVKSSRVCKDQKGALTPLKMPDLAIHPKATWRKVLEEDIFNQKDAGDHCNKSPNDFKVYKNKFNTQVIGKINDFNLKCLRTNSPRRNILSKNISTIPESEFEKPEVKSKQSTENDLRVFEVLEERVEHSSFSSTNSSILRLLSSTPNKDNNKITPQNQVLEDWNENEACHIQGIQNALLQKKLQEVNQRTDVLHDFLKNLKSIGNDGDKRCSNSPDSAQDRTLDTSFSDEEKWSNTDTDISQPVSSNYTDTIRYSILKIDAAVNTSMEKIEQIEQKCEECEKLQAKLENVERQLPDILTEKARVCDFAKELEDKRDQLIREMETMKLRHESIASELKQQLENERKKFQREKMVFDMYVKDSRNRPTRKEREQIYELKQELADCQELMKLKDTKSGATQARLRTQVKQLEKENTELKQELDKLQRENAKLTAAQVKRRPSEMKMLHEINKNITKLAEETLKKQQNKVDTCCNTKEPKILDSDSEQDRTPKGKKNSSLKPKVSESSNTSSNTEDISKFEMTTFADIYLEKKYETEFGQFSAHGTSDNNLDDSKKDRTETVYADGSKEIKYSNGNTKTISPNGNVTIMKYYNGDIKETNLSDNTMKYFYSDNSTWQTHYGDGSEVLEYPDGQKEKTYPDGRKEVHCIDGSFLCVNPDGTEEIMYPDGSKLIKNLSGEKILLLPNGQKEVHTREHKRREYPDGTVKILYPDGTQETRYASGRIRIKDGNGVLVMDSQN